MSKIAILTQPLGHNYGGILQAWALQQVILEIGYDPITINRKENRRSILYKAARLTKRLLLTFKEGQRFPLNSPDNAELTSLTREFLQKYIATSENISSAEQLRQHAIDNDYYAVIVGSDQVWRPKYSYEITNFFLDFCQDLDLVKVAYAASFGVCHWEFTPKQTLVCRQLASNFDAIGVREDSGVRLCHDYLHVNSTEVLDPTLLLDPCRYKQLLYKQEYDFPPPAEEYICCYFFKIDESLLNRLHQISVLLDRRIRFANFRGDTFAPDLVTRMRLQPVLPPVEYWLQTFYSSAFVITDSFHGMLFSIIFNKPFVVIDNSERGSSRFSSILSKIDAMNRLCSSIDSIDLDCLRSPISSDSYSVLQDLQAQSINFLCSSLQEKS
jgi:hypothetical protein